jgi:hypothetical protein
MYRNLATATRIVAVSNPDQTSGYIEFEARDGNTYRRYRYQLTGGNVQYGQQYGRVWDLQDLAQDLGTLRFLCYDGQDLDNPIANCNQIRLVKIQTSVKGQTWTAAVCLRVQQAGGQ